MNIPIWLIEVGVGIIVAITVLTICHWSEK
jgi:hypothetical protein